MITLQTERITDVVIVDENGIRYKIEREDTLNRLKKNDAFGQTGGMEWFLEQTQISFSTAKTTILLPFKEELRNFVSYPGENGKYWRFKKTEMKQWLEDNWTRYAKQ